MAGRKVRDAAEAQSCLAELGDVDGRTRASWARARGIDPRSLHAWWLNLGGRRRREQASSLRLVELVVEAPSSSPRYVVRFGDAAIEVDEHFDDATLRRLLRVVATC